MPARSFSRSSGVNRAKIASCALRRSPNPPRLKNPPNKIRLSTSNPSACQNVINFPPNTAGTTQFHKFITINPNTAAARITSGTITQTFRVPRR